MNRLGLVGVVRLVVLVLFFLVSGLGSVEELEAKGLKERWQERKERRKGDKIKGDSKEEKRVAGVESVLLVTEPIHQIDIEDGSTIAFIDFSHIEDAIPDRWKTFQRTETRAESSMNGSRTVKSESYSVGVCARQVESALAQHLADLNRFRVVTRDQIQSVLDEQDFNYTGRVSTRTSARLGELIGADILIYGQVQLCVSSRMGNESVGSIVSSVSDELKGVSGFLEILKGVGKGIKSQDLRSYILAQVQMIEADTGKRLFTTSLAGEFDEKSTDFPGEMEHRELVYRASDDLADQFIDDLLARQDARYLDLYTDNAWDFKQGLNWIRLGQCGLAERYFASLYPRFRGQMKERDIARLMYNHGIALMCSNRSEEAADRLWASLRLSNDEKTFEAIKFTNDTVDRGRRVQAEDDEIIRDVVHRLYEPSTVLASEALKAIPSMPSPKG